MCGGDTCQGLGEGKSVSLWIELTGSESYKEKEFILANVFQSCCTFLWGTQLGKAWINRLHLQKGAGEKAQGSHFASSVHCV